MAFLRARFSSLNPQVALPAPKPRVRDPLRKKSVAAGPEEKVRQGLIRWLMREIKVPANFIAVEFSLSSLDPSTRKRADVVVWKPAGKSGGLHPWLLAECKAPGLELDNRVADQVRRYAQNIRADYVLLTNGTKTLCFGFAAGKYAGVENLPVFSI